MRTTFVGGQLTSKQDCLENNLVEKIRNACYDALPIPEHSNVRRGSSGVDVRFVLVRLKRGGRNDCRSRCVGPDAIKHDERAQIQRIRANSAGVRLKLNKQIDLRRSKSAHLLRRNYSFALFISDCRSLNYLAARQSVTTRSHVHFAPTNHLE
jgi:hypothetical protein